MTARSSESIGLSPAPDFVPEFTLTAEQQSVAEQRLTRLAATILDPFKALESLTFVESMEAYDTNVIERYMYEQYKAAPDSAPHIDTIVASLYARSQEGIKSYNKLRPIEKIGALCFVATLELNKKESRSTSESSEDQEPTEEKEKISPLVMTLEAEANEEEQNSSKKGIT